MKTTRLQLTHLRIQSFVTSINAGNALSLKGGTKTIEETAYKGCVVTEYPQCSVPENSAGGGSDTDPNGNS